MERGQYLFCYSNDLDLYVLSSVVIGKVSILLVVCCPGIYSMCRVVKRYPLLNSPFLMWCCLLPMFVT